MFIICFISSHLEFGSVNHTSIYENSELKVFKNRKVLGEMTKQFIWSKYIQDY